MNETVHSLEGGRPTSPSQVSTSRSLFNTLSITEVAASALAQQRSQAVASPSTPSHTGPWVNPSPSSMGSSDASINLSGGLSSVRDSQAQSSGVDSTVEQSGSTQHALDPLLLEAENVMTNPMFGMDAQGASVPATPSTPASQLQPAVALQQVSATCSLQLAVATVHMLPYDTGCFDPLSKSV